jgi:hypothetical protein
MVSTKSGEAPRTPATTFDGEQESEREASLGGRELGCGRKNSVGAASALYEGRGRERAGERKKRSLQGAIDERE